MNSQLLRQHEQKGSRWAPMRRHLDALMRTGGRLPVAIVLTVTIAISAFAGPAHAQDEVERDCETVTFPVSTGTIAGTLCQPGGGATAKAAFVLTTGSAVNSVYWDFPHQPETYSFSRAMNAAGYTTLALDRPGNGKSSTPPFWAVTATGDAAGVHTAVQSLRNGIPGVIDPIDTVVLGGNALGSAVSVIEAATHNDVDGVLLTGYSRSIDPVVALDSLKTFRHAADDPAFRGSDPGWLTIDFLAPESARNYFGPVTTPKSSHGPSAPRTSSPPPSGPTGSSPACPARPHASPPRCCWSAAARIDSGAISYCAATPTASTPTKPHFFGPGARLRTWVLDGGWDMINLSRGAPEYHAAVRDWMSSTTG